MRRCHSSDSFGKARRGRIKIEVRIVARVDEEIHGVNHLEELQKVFRIVRTFGRLGRNADVIGKVIQRASLHPGYLHTHLFVVIVEAPEKGNDPRESAFGEDDFEGGEALKNAFREETDEMSLEPK